MNKSDKIIVAVLALLLCGWFYLSRQNAKAQAAFYAEHPELVPTAQVAASEPEPGVEGESVAEGGAASEAAFVAEPEEPASATPETRYTCSNDVAEFVFSSKGGALCEVRMLGFAATREAADEKASLAFGSRPALAYESIPGLGKAADFAFEPVEGGVRMTARTADGLVLERTALCTNGYSVALTDVFRNEGAASRVLDAGLSLGGLRAVGENAKDLDFGVDARVTVGKAKTLEQNLSKGFSKGAPSLAAMFGASGGGCKASTLAPSAPIVARSGVFAAPVDWVAVRERFFVQILTPAAAGVGVETVAVRRPWTDRGLALENVSAVLKAAPATLEPGASVVSAYSYYAGPRKLSELRKLSPAHTDVMRFGTWSFFCRFLLDFLNFLHDKLHVGYGWAIILLTIVVRLILFPLNRKSTESMKKMSAIQPQLKELQAKYKDDPRKLQQEQMKLYSQNHVNPMASCLPMLIQLPIFIALFTVLRTCVELRFAPFLWIADLSEPENCFRAFLTAHGIPFGINFLPITMAVTMTLQSRLTPSTGDAAQQKMMMVMMPVMMLFICYNFASALGLYWTVSQALAIFGLWRGRRAGARTAKHSFTQEDGTEVLPPRVTRQMRRHG